MKAFTVSTAAIAKCKQKRLDPKHYREDGTCKCFRKKAPVLKVEFVAIGPYAWGKADTVTDAVKNCKANLSSGKHKVLVMRVVGFNHVDGMNGAINYNAKGSCEKVDEQMVTRR